MSVFETALILATLLCALTAGLVFAFATVVMPGIATMSDREYIRAFQVIDGVIQAGQPVFGLVWMGSLLAVVAAATLSVLQLDGIIPAMLVIAAASYALGVQLPTFRVNVPLNNALQALDVDAMDADALAAARGNFEHRWMRWNTIRTVVATLVSATLLVALLWL